MFRAIFKLRILENSLRKLIIGRSPDDFISKLAPNNYQYSTNSFRQFDYNGIKLNADIHDYVGHYLYYGFLDSGQKALMSLVSKDFIILDIGTNIGSTLLQFAYKIGPNGRVFGFEPDTENYANCMHNIGLNNFKNVSVDNIGLGSASGEFLLSIDCESNRGGNRIVANPSVNAKKIKVDTLDHWVEINNITKLDLIKIDVEGYEMNVLEGGLATISKYHPILFIELDDNNLKLQNSSAIELVSLLLKCGYVIVHAETNQEVTSDFNFSDTYFDIICRCS
jgi:FkbM family methyltransferase